MEKGLHCTEVKVEDKDNKSINHKGTQRDTKGHKGVH